MATFNANAAKSIGAQDKLLEQKHNYLIDLITSTIKLLNADIGNGLTLVNGKLGIGNELQALQSLADTSGFVKKVSDGVYSIDTATYQPLNNELSALSALADTAGLLKKTGDGTYVIDTTGYVASTTLANYKTFSGFENRTDSTIAINSSTGVFTLAPTTTSFTIYTNVYGKRVLSAPQTVTVTNDQTITYIYIDDNGVLQKSLTSWNLEIGDTAPCSIVFKDGSTYSITDERHSHERNKSWHKWAHNNIGTVYNSGLIGTFTNTTLSVTQGIIYDEDLLFNTGSTKTTCSLWYRNATTGMRLIRGSSTPYRAVAGVLQYDNGSGTLQPVGNAKFINSWVYCANDPVEPIYIVIGQNEYNTQALAQAATAPQIRLSTAEWKLIYRVIYHNANGTPIYDQALDYHNVQTGVATMGIPPTSHTGLTDRDSVNSHPASAITNTPAGNIAATDVQAAINELDTEKQANLTFGIADTNKVQINAIDVADNDYAKFTATGIEGRSYVEVLSDIGAQPAGTYLTATNIDDTAYGAGWNGDTTHAPSKNAVYDKIETLVSNLDGGVPNTNFGATSSINGGTP